MFLQVRFFKNESEGCFNCTSQVSTFAINYRGHPFMESLTENRSLLYSLAGAGGFVVMLALGWLPEFSDQFSIVDFSDEFRSILLQVILGTHDRS